MELNYEQRQDLYQHLIGAIAEFNAANNITEDWSLNVEVSTKNGLADATKLEIQNLGLYGKRL